MKIFVDADACPVVRIVESIAKKYKVPIIAVRYESRTFIRLQ